MSGWQTREVDTCTARLFICIMMKGAKDGRDKGPGKSQIGKIRKTKMVVLFDCQITISLLSFGA